MSQHYFEKIDYDDSDKYVKKETHYNGGMVIYIKVTDIRKNVVCCKCGKQMGPRGKGSRVYCDIKDGSGNDWKILYVSYEYTREYVCKNCGAINKEVRKDFLHDFRLLRAVSALFHLLSVTL